MRSWLQRVRISRGLLQYCSGFLALKCCELVCVQDARARSKRSTSGFTRLWMSQARPWHACCAARRHMRLQHFAPRCVAC